MYYTRALDKYFIQASCQLPVTLVTAKLVASDIYSLFNCVLCRDYTYPK